MKSPKFSTPEDLGQESQKGGQGGEYQKENRGDQGETMDFAAIQGNGGQGGEIRAERDARRENFEKVPIKKSHFPGGGAEEKK